jgi:hypothetical protein
MRNILRIFTLFCILGIFSINIQAQYFETPQKKPTFKDRLYFGGGLGLQFGQVTLIDVSPLIAYKLTNRLHPGIGLSYSYYNDKSNNVPIEFSTYGGSVFTRFFIFESLFAHVEAEYLNIKVYTFTGATTYETKRQWIDNYLVGGGYFQKIGEKSGIYFTILWNLNQTELTPYSNPVMRIGFNF